MQACKLARAPSGRGQGRGAVEITRQIVKREIDDPPARHTHASTATAKSSTATTQLHLTTRSYSSRTQSAGQLHFTLLRSVSPHGFTSLPPLHRFLRGGVVPLLERWQRRLQLANGDGTQFRLRGVGALLSQCGLR